MRSVTRTVGLLCVAAAMPALLTIGCAESSSRPAELTGAIAFIARDTHLFTVDAADSTLTRIGRLDLWRSNLVA